MAPPITRSHLLALLAVAALIGALAALIASRAYHRWQQEDGPECPLERAGPADVVMFGDSLTQFHCWRADHPRLTIVNRGRAGDTTDNLLARVDEILLRRPKAVVLLVGTNDIARGRPVPAIVGNYRRLVARLAPATRLYLVTVPPCSSGDCDSAEQARIVPLNRAIASLAAEHRAGLIDLYGALATPDGGMPEKYTTDGEHLNQAGYAVWDRLLEPVWTR
jgi:lysophospholipase L1-like esterase